MTPGRRIAFFGGAFDPPHRGHVAVAQRVLEARLSDLVLWVPSWSPPHKTASGMASYDDRMAMAKLAVHGLPGCAVSDIEGRKRFTPSYSIRVLEALEAENPGCRVQLLIGSDSLEELHTWYCARELAGRYEIIAYPRRTRAESGSSAAVVLPETFWSDAEAERLRQTVVSGNFVEVSSTELREALSSGGEDGGKVANEAVLMYIKEHGLYGMKPKPGGE